VSPTLTTFLFEAANFLVLAGVLAWLFFRPVRDALERRRAQQQEQADEAAEKLAEAERMRAEIEHKYANLDRELEQRREQSATAAEQQSSQIVRDAREAARRESEVAMRRMTHLERSQREHLARVIAETTGVTIDHFLRQLGEGELDHVLTGAVCREIRSFDGNSLAPVRIESAHPLVQADRDALLAVLGAAGESAEFHVIEDLGMGLRVSTNRGLVDASSAGLSTFAQHQLASLLESNDDSIGEDEPNG
jgi:F0F1-type ATP synthase membrane subunit b/b'